MSSRPLSVFLSPTMSLPTIPETMPHDDGRTRLADVGGGGLRRM